MMQISRAAWYFYLQSSVEEYQAHLVNLLLQELLGFNSRE